MEHVTNKNEHQDVHAGTLHSKHKKIQNRNAPTAFNYA